MSISGIQSSNHENYYANKKANSQSEDIPSRQRGSDTVSFSDKAISKMQEDMDIIAEEKSEKPSGGKSPSVKTSMLALMMESLLMAQLAENGDSSPKPNNDAGSEQNNTQQDGESENTMTKSDGQDKPKGVAQEGEVVKGIKNAINDFMFGGGGMSAVFSAMKSTPTNTATTNTAEISSISDSNKSKVGG